MAAASDKARFYLEQSIPELRELQKHKIFTKEELRSIVKKRTDFEHKLNARGSKPVDFARYLEYEMNLETLRKKRAKRMGQKIKGEYAGQRRMLFIMDRATRKFPGDLGLWTQYFELARQQQALKKASEILTSMLRLHPTAPELWTHAAKYHAEEQGDMTEARSYMQRGLRFCKSSRQLWLDYCKLELIYVAKIAARRKILGLDKKRQYNEVHDEDDPHADIIALPTVTAEDYDPSLRKTDEVDEEALESMSNTPAQTGAIPMAIFDAAMENFKDADLAGQFFDITAEMPEIPCSKRILSHFKERLLAMAPNNPVTSDAIIRLPLAGVDPTSAEFPRCLGPVLARLKEIMNKHPSLILAKRSITWIASYLEQGIDEDVRKVLSAILSRTVSQYFELAKSVPPSPNELAWLLDRARASNLPAIEEKIGTWALETWPKHELIESTVGERLKAIAAA